MNIIVGLGNPGEKYKTTRHNVGFMAVDVLAEKLGLSWRFDKKFNAEVIKSDDLLLIKPFTFMNNSGIPVRSVLSYYKSLPKKLGMIAVKNSDLTNALTVIHDDIDIDLGKYKTSINSGGAGHRGVQSIIDHLKTKNFKRFRVGIKTKYKEHCPTEKFVLQRFNKEELAIMGEVINDVLSEI